MENESATLFPPPAECAGSQQLTAASLLIYYTARKERYGYMYFCDVMRMSIYINNTNSLSVTLLFV